MHVCEKCKEIDTNKNMIIADDKYYCEDCFKRILYTKEENELLYEG